MGFACLMIGMHKGKKHVNASPVSTVKSHTPSIHNYEIVHLPQYELDGFHDEPDNQGNAENENNLDDNDIMIFFYISEGER